MGTRSGMGLGACAALMVGLAAVVRAAAITYDGWTRYGAQSRIGDASAGALTYVERVQAVTTSTIVVVASLIAVAAAGIVFVCWLQRAWVRSAAMATTRLRFGREWTVGAWLVPIYNLVAPPRVVADIWRASAGGRNVSTAPVSDWWTGVIITCALDLYAMITYDAYLAAAARTIEGVVTLVAAWLLMTIIARITAWQLVATRRAPVDQRPAPVMYPRRDTRRTVVGHGAAAAWRPGVISRPVRRAPESEPAAAVSRRSGPRR